MKRALSLLLACLMVMTSVAALATEGKTPDELVAEYQAARALGTNDRLKQWYDPAIFDLSDLPEYAPTYEVSGKIRQWGSNYIEDSGLVQIWEAEFKTWHPDVIFEDTLTSSANAFPGLITGMADIGQMGREAVYDELNGFQRQCALGYAMAISTCFGSYEVRGWTFSLAVFVNKENPIDSLTLQQVDGIFGAARTGGWKGLTWDPDLARGPEENIRTWGQLGLTGEWEDAPIQQYGYNMSYHFPDEFEKKVFGGGQRWAENMIEVANAIGQDGRIVNGGTFMTDAVAADKFAICYCGAPFLNDGVKMLALAKDADSPAYENSYENIHNALYPLTREIFAYANPLQAVNPVVYEFFKYITSRQGQQRVADDAKYVPMNAQACLDQWEVLDSSAEKAIAYFNNSEIEIKVGDAALDSNAVDFIGTIMVPVDDVVKALGGTYTYDESSYEGTIALKDGTYTVKHGNVKVTANGENMKISQPCFVVDGVMYIPVEYLTDIMAIDVEVDSETGDVNIHA